MAKKKTKGRKKVGKVMPSLGAKPTPQEESQLLSFVALASCLRGGKQEGCEEVGRVMPSLRAKSTLQQERKSALQGGVVGHGRVW